MRTGRLVVLGSAGPAAGYTLKGGVVGVVGRSGPRAGLNQSGGTLVLLGPTGRLAGERQSGGTLFARPTGWALSRVTGASEAASCR